MTATMGRDGERLAAGWQRVALGVWLVGLALAVAMAAGWLEVFTQIPDDDSTGLLMIILVSLMILYGLLGRLLVARRPRETVGWLFLATPVQLGITFGGYSIIGWKEVQSYGVQLRSLDLLEPLVPIAGTIASASFAPTILVAFPLLAIVFPDGRLPGPRWRWPVRALLGGTLVSVLATLFGDATDPYVPTNPLAVPGLSDELAQLGGLSMVMTLLSGVALGVLSVIVRVARGTPVERRQLAWFLGATGIVASLLALTITGENVTEPLDLVAIASLGLLPLATTLAVLRYRLYEIDRVVSRTIAYAVITAILVAVFAGAVLASQALLADVTGGDTLPVALSTLLVFALFQPLRSSVQGLVDRRFNRAKVDAQRAVDAFALRLRDEVDLVTVRDATLTTASAIVEPRSATLWVRGGAAT